MSVFDHKAGAITPPQDGSGGHRCGVFDFDRILAGTALALVLTLAGQAQSQSNSPSIDAAVPVPEAADVPPPTAADIAKSAPTVTPGPQAAPAVAPARTGRHHHRNAGSGRRTRASPRPHRQQRRPPPRRRGTRSIRSRRSFAKSSPARATACSAAKASGRGVEAFYRERNYAPLWVNNGAPSARATEAIAYLRGVDADGLEPSEYPVPDFKSTDPAAMAETELKFTDTILTFARHAQNGRVHWSRVSSDIFYNQDPVEPAAVLARSPASKTAGETLGSYLPQHSLYTALKAQARRSAQAEGRQLAHARRLRSGAQDRQGAGAGRARAAAAREARRRRRQVRHHLRQGTGGRRRQIPEEARASPRADRSPRPPSTRSTVRAATATPTSSSPISNAGAGCRTTSARPASWSTFPITRCG